ncbi:unnamed protein product [Mytilus edulis]|uniref:B box-type domain-containing protein n=1 Tax=Mytilus edulis TaxID=6550 RepID=A0A8S3QAE0_MYTED|nr:unnamed protein product [Mytilus edulis]
MAQIPSQNCTFCSKIAALYCYDCQQCLCTQCQKNIHGIVAVCQDHKVGDIHKAGNRIYKSVPTCEAHNKEFICYCGKCDCLTCKECITSSHNGHITKEIKNIADIRRKDVSQIINKLKTKVKEIEETLKQLMEVIRYRYSRIVIRILRTSRKILRSYIRSLIVIN